MDIQDRRSIPPRLAMKAPRGRNVVARLILHLSASWIRLVSVTPQSLYPRERTPQNPMNMRLQPQSRWRRSDEEKHLLPLPGFKPTTLRWRFKRLFVCFWPDNPPPPQWARASSFTGFLDHAQRRTTVGRTPLDEWSARLRDHLHGNTPHSQVTYIHSLSGNRTQNISRRAAADPRLRPHGHRDRLE